MASLEDQTPPRLWLVGCGTPTPTPARFGSCLVLRVEGEHLMFDCGPAATYKMVKAGVAPTDISHLFFTHHHYDHNADTPCFLLCRWDHERPGVPRLKVHGPPPTALITERLIWPEGAFNDDWRARVEHPASQAVYAVRGGQVPRPPPPVRRGGHDRDLRGRDRVRRGAHVARSGIGKERSFTTGTQRAQRKLRLWDGLSFKKPG